MRPGATSGPRVGSANKGPTKLVKSTKTAVSSGDTRSSDGCRRIVKGFRIANDMMDEAYEEG